MNASRKGARFERRVASELSLWWSGGERDDIFYRSSQSGGRATQRAKSHRTTAGSYGDIAAIDPSGAPLLEVFTIELKKGKSHGGFGDLIGLLPCSGRQRFEDVIEQVARSQEAAGSLSWLIISQQHRRDIMVCGVWKVLSRLHVLPESLIRWRGGITLVTTSFSEFKKIPPESIKYVWKNQALF